MKEEITDELTNDQRIKNNIAFLDSITFQTELFSDICKFIEDKSNEFGIGNAIVVRQILVQTIMMLVDNFGDELAKDLIKQMIEDIIKARKENKK